MDLLATAADLSVRLGRDLNSSEIDRAEALLRDASSRVRREALNQQISADTTTIRLPIRRGMIDLPQYPVTAVTSVKNDAGQDVGVQWSTPASWIYVGSVDRFDMDWGYGCSYLTVTYAHGYDPVPDDIIGVVCQIAGRAFGVTLESAGITSEQLGAYQYATGGAAAQGGFGMLADEKLVARGYRKPSRPISML